MPLFIDYTSVFDDPASKVSFEPTQGSEKIAVQSSGKPKFELVLITEVETFATAGKWASFISWTAAIIFLGASGAITYFFYYPEWANDTYLVYYSSFTGVITIIFTFFLKSIMSELVYNNLTPQRIEVDVD